MYFSVVCIRESSEMSFLTFLRGYRLYRNLFYLSLLILEREERP